MTTRSFQLRLKLHDFMSYRGSHEVLIDHRLVAVLGPNGAGKTCLIEAVTFACSPSNTGDRLHLVPTSWIELDIIGPESIVSLRRSLSGFSVNGVNVDVEQYQSQLRRYCILSPVNINGALIERIGLFREEDLSELIQNSLLADSNVLRREQWRSIEDLNLNISKFKRQLRDINLERRTVVNNTAELESLVQLRQNRPEIKRQLDDEIAKQAELQRVDHETKLDDIRREIEKAQEEVETENVTQMTMENLKRDYQERLKAIMQEKTKLLGEIDDLVGENLLKEGREMYLRRSEEALTTQLQSVRLDLQDSEMAKSRLAEEIQDLKHDLVETRRNIESDNLPSIHFESDEVTNHLLAKLESKRSLELELSDINSNRSLLDQRLKHNQVMHDSIVNRCHGIQKTRDVCDEQLIDVHLQMSNLNSAIQAKIAHKTKLEKQLESQKTKSKISRYHDSELQSILHQNRTLDTIKSKVPGVADFLKHLISVRDTQYRKALDTALGVYAESIVVTSTVVVETCLDLLRQEERGSFTFLVRDTIVDYASALEQDDKLLQNLPQGTKYISDIVVCPPDIRPFVKLVIGDTIVAPSIESALSLRRAGVKSDIVCIDGTALDTFNVMSSPMIARAMSDSSPGAVEDLGFNLSYKQCLDGLAILETEMRDLVDKELRIQQELSLTQEDLDNGRQLMATLSEDVLGIESSIQESSKSSRRLKNSIEELAQEISALSNPSNGGTGKLLIPEEVNFGAFLAASSRLSSLNKTITQRETDLGTLSDQILLFRADVDRLQLNLQNTSEEASRVESCRHTLTSSISDLRNKLDEEIKPIEAVLNEKLHEATTAIGSASLKETDLYDKLATLRSDVDLLEKDTEWKITRETDHIVRLRQNLSVSQIPQGVDNQLAVLAGQYNTLNQLWNEKRSQVSRLEESRALQINTIASNITPKLLEFQKELSSIYRGLSGRHSHIHLQPTDPSIPWSGFGLMAQPSHKRYAPVRSLSGGERAVVVLSLLLATQKMNGCQLIIFDEVDSSLDRHNVVMLKRYLMRRHGSRIYLFSSHNEAINDSAALLIGIYNGDNGSNALSVLNPSNMKENNDPSIS